jgi:nicotinate-nucleotide adenylyltransferase
VRSAAFAGLPPHAPGQRIGLFGGSFNPPHDGHRAASLLALKRLQLDVVWWLVTPGNPLKDNGGLPPTRGRVAAAQRVAAHPRIVITDFEEELGSPYTCDTIAALTRRCPTIRFVWIMGADSLAGFHRWKDWRRIANSVPLCVIDRPGSTLRAVQTRSAAALRAYRMDERDAKLLPGASLPAFVFLHGPRSSLSSTALRASATAP